MNEQLNTAKNALKAYYAGTAEQVYPDDPAMQQEYMKVYWSKKTLVCAVTDLAIRRAFNHWAKARGWGWWRRNTAIFAIQFLHRVVWFGPIFIKVYGDSFRAIPRIAAKAVQETREAHQEADEGDLDGHFQILGDGRSGMPTQAEILQIMEVLKENPKEYFENPELLQEKVQEIIGDRAGVTVRAVPVGEMDDDPMFKPENKAESFDRALQSWMRLPKAD